MKPTLTQAHLTPAYGRTYITKEQLLHDFNRGLDFIISGPQCNHTYASIRDCKPKCKITFRYGRRLQKSFTHTV